MTRRKAPVMRTITVVHPTHGTYMARNVRDKLSAVQAAARAWGLQWSQIARECEFTEGEDNAEADSS